MRSISILVSNDVQTDRRVIRIAELFYSEGYVVTIIGRSLGKKWSHEKFNISLLSLWSKKGPFFYLELNLRLWLYILSHPTDVIYVVDFDTLLAARMTLLVSRPKFIFDAHELFTEVPELDKRPIRKKIWGSLARWVIPYTDLCITVSEPIAQIMEHEYEKPFFTILNTPLFRSCLPLLRIESNRLVLVYLGVLNEGRGLIEIIKRVALYHQLELHIIGDGVLMKELRKQAKGVERIIFHGQLSEELFLPIVKRADVGINLLDGSSESYRLSLANKFFDYMHQGVAIITMDFPCYRDINNEINGAVLISDLSQKSIDEALLLLLNSRETVKRMKERNLLASSKYSWQAESQKLLALVNDIMD